MNIDEMTIEQVIARMKEIKGLINSADADSLKNLTEELDNLIERKKALEAGALA